ncbi:MAG: hypothetical protein JRG72_01295 [Deltaproteobacteria bacterium]|nr:hypothetical protein [Deltaproteobacteria bacterium]
MPPANLYLSRIQWLPYLDSEECQAVGVDNAEHFLSSLNNGTLELDDCHNLSPQKRYALKLALTAGDWLPRVESMPLPQPTAPGLFEINIPDPHTPVLVSGNSQLTLTVLTAVLATTISPFYLLLIDCRGDTVDMAMVYETFTPVRLERGLKESDLAARIDHRQLVIPGLCASLQEPLAAQTGWQIQIGPICAAELPLFFGERWLPPLDV